MCLDKAHSCPPLHVLQSYEQAAAVLLAGATSLQALRKHTNVQEGSRVLILGGSGGTGVCVCVWFARSLLACSESTQPCAQTHRSPQQLAGSLAIQIAKHYGAIVATTASDRNLEFVADLGADQVINYRKENFGEVRTAVTSALITLKLCTSSRYQSMFCRAGAAWRQV